MALRDEILVVGPEPDAVRLRQGHRDTSAEHRRVPVRRERRRPALQQRRPRRVLCRGKARLLHALRHRDGDDAPRRTSRPDWRRGSCRASSISGRASRPSMSNAHAWVEVFFPGYGWQPFDPTGGAQGSEPLSGALPAGVPSGSATPNLELDQGQRHATSLDRGARRCRPEPGRHHYPPRQPTMLILTALLLMLVVGGLAAIVWWRGPRGEVTPDSAWGAIGRLGARFGFGPRPTQTVYEYASTLGTVVPIAKADLETVARAKVETAYARKRLSNERLRGLRKADRHLRVSLLRLVLRRGIPEASGASAPAADPRPIPPWRIRARGGPRPRLPRGRPTARGLPRPPRPARRGGVRDVPWSCGA